MSGESLWDAAVDALGRRLPPKWTVQTLATANGSDPDLLIGDPGGTQRSFLVEARLRFNPADAKAVLGGSLTRRLLRTTYPTPLLVVAPFLSSRTRQLLIADGHNYLDLTGNVHIAIDHPGLFIHTQGDDRDPVRATSTRRGVTGAAAGQVVRYLIDNTPPSTASQIAAATTVNLGYVSRVLEYLASEAVIDRLPRGPVTSVERDTLIRYRAQALGCDTKQLDTDSQLAWLHRSDPAWAEAEAVAWAVAGDP